MNDFMPGFSEIPLGVFNENESPQASFPSLEESVDDEHNENLAEKLDAATLSLIASELLRDIEDDQQSRSERLAQRDKALGLLGLTIEAPRSDTSSGGAPFDGMSTFKDQGMLEACVHFQANTRGEMLPATGPVKVENSGEPIQQKDLLAEALENAINKFLTVGSPEYYPDSDRSFFQVGWAGCAFKKGYHCPLRRRPVLDAIDEKDLIISANATDVDTAPRATHVIKMDQTTFRHMQVAGAYLDVELGMPTEEKTVVDQRLENIQGVSQRSSSPKNLDRTIYESYTNWDLPGYEHEKDGELTGLPLPYKITVDKDARQVLEIRRNWKASDPECNRRKTFVMYPFIPAFGLYPLGLMNLMGNTENGLTAAFRIAIDNGMYNNFNSWLYAKSGGGQDKNDFRAGPGQGIPVNVPAGGDIRNLFMPIPTKPLDPAFIQLVQAMQQSMQRIGGTANLQIGEGNQQAPVGTTIALIEQATKIMSGVHKRLHKAQAEEFRMLRDLLQEDPEALWRWSGKEPYNKAQIIQALNDYDLIPQADPNVASHMIRIQRAEAVRALVKDNPMGWDIKAITEWYCDQIGIPEVKRFILPPPPPQPLQASGPDNGARAAAAIQTQQMKSADAAQDRELKRLQMQMHAEETRVKLAQQKEEHQLDLAKELVIHPLSQSIISQNNPLEGV